MKLILALALVVVLVCQLLDASPVIEDRDQDAAYEEHKKAQGLTFTGEEDDRRRAEFKATDDHIKAHNADPSKTSTLVHNHLSTMHDHEIATMNGYRQSAYTPPTEPATSRMIADRSEPTNLDWRDNNGNYVSPIQQQGQCGSCWTFSASATLESRWAIKHGLPLQKLSEQCLVDCAHWDSSSGNLCEGGNVNTAWSWVASIAGQNIGDGTITGTNPAALPKPTTGQNLESEYPYVDSNYKKGDAAHSCGFAVSKGNDVSSSTYTTTKTTPASKYCSQYTTPWSWTSSTGWVAGTKYCSEWVHTAAVTKTTYHGSYSITANSPSAMKTALQAGPVSVAIYAGGKSFQQYGSGILQEASCAGDDLDHAVNLIGYGEDASGNLYWLGRNSWGTYWGDDGYFKFERKTTDSVGTCGVLREGAYPVM